MDYGHSLEFGYFLIPDAGDPRGVLETARLADRLGYDLLAVQDHARRRVPSRTADPLRRRSTVKDGHEERRAGEA